MSLSLLAVAGAGLATYLTPCVLPLVPIYLAALTGGDVTALDRLPRGRLLARAGLFVGGFLLVFVPLGSASALAGDLLRPVAPYLQALGGVVVLLFGLKFLGVVQIPFLDRTLRARESRLATRFAALNALLMGVFFAAGWSPCVGPVLGAVLTYTASSGADPLTGGLYLAVYGLGFGLPLIATALFASRALPLLARLRSWLPRFERLTGVAMLLLGIGLLGDAVALPAAAALPPTASLAQGKSVLLELYAADCPICQEMMPVVAEVARECQDGRTIIKQVDVGLAENRDWIARHRVLGVPTFVFLDPQGHEAARLVGRQSQQALHQALATVRGERCDAVGTLPPPTNPVSADTQEQGTTCPSTNLSAPSAANAPRPSGASPIATSTSPVTPATAPPAACSLGSR